ACRPPLPSCFSLYLSLVPPSPLLFPYTTLFRSRAVRLQRPLLARGAVAGSLVELGTLGRRLVRCLEALSAVDVDQCENVSGDARSEERRVGREGGGEGRVVGCGVGWCVGGVWWG